MEEKAVKERLTAQAVQADCIKRTPGHGTGLDHANGPGYVCVEIVPGVEERRGHQQIASRGAPEQGEQHRYQCLHTWWPADHRPSATTGATQQTDGPPGR